MTRLRIPIVCGLCAFFLTYSSGVSVWWSAVAGLVAGLAWAVRALL